MKTIPYKTACTNGLPDDKHMMFETCRRRQELNSNNLRSVHVLVTLHINLFTLSCMFNGPFFSAENTIPICSSVYFSRRLLFYLDQSWGCHSYRPMPERQWTNPRSLLSCEFLRVSCHWGVAWRRVIVSCSFFTYISALEDETTTMLRNVWYPSPSDAATHPRIERERGGRERPLS